MKTLRLKNTKNPVTRELISSIGEKIYHSKGIDAVSINVKYKDGSAVSFKRSELGDKFERAIQRDDCDGEE